MQKTCKQCAIVFDITDGDLQFYDKVSPVFLGKKYQIPTPTLCPECRQQRRLAFRNERNLYHRKCDLTGKTIISMYSSDKPYRVYDQTVWWSDQWDPLTYGRDFDFNRSFFEQFYELLIAVPRINLINKEHENSEYANFCLKNKDCYLLFTSGFCKNSYYSNRSFKIKDSADCSSCYQCELCYELVDCENCYNSRWLQYCSHCSDCILGFNLQGCQNCFSCYNLTNAKFCIENIQYTESEYRRKVGEFMKNFDEAKLKFEHVKKNAVRKYINGIQLEHCTGDALFSSKNALDCYESKNLQDCRYLYNTTNMKDSQDVNNDDYSELVYEVVGSDSNYMHCFSDICWFDSNSYYNSLCFNSKNIFGCSGLKKNEYCILNKQYSKAKYEKIVPVIIEHMQKTGEWGEFFHPRISPFGYNETLAFDYLPLTKDEALKHGFRWHEATDKEIQYYGQKYQIPATIEDTSDDITKQILRCEVTGKLYKIIPQELVFYRQMGLPVPRRCPDQRHKDRLALRNPRKLWKRVCANCHATIETTYAPECPEKIYCEMCYLKTVY